MLNVHLVIDCQGRLICLDKDVSAHFCVRRARNGRLVSDSRDRSVNGLLA